MRTDFDTLRASLEALQPFSSALFDELQEKTRDGAGVSRETYGPGEQYAHDLIRTRARELELATQVDGAGNLYVTLPGRDPLLPAWITGSHLDSVPSGGNYDGAAGVIAGLTALAAFRRAQRVPLRSVTVMAIRAEEASSWYGGRHSGHLGSRAALGLLRDDELAAAVHVGTGRTLQEKLKDMAFHTSGDTAGSPDLAAGRYRGYVELHIEQGPVLEGERIPVGIVTGIRGSARARNAKCIGEYTHSGAVPHEYRHDAVLATAELCFQLERAAENLRARGADLVFTVGKFFTDERAHSISKVPGETNFAVEFRSQDVEVLRQMMAAAQGQAAEIGRSRRVTFQLGEFDLSRPATMDAGLCRLLDEGAKALSIPAIPIASGAGHDAQEFSRAGFATGMIFVRNANGSHNPRESMAREDFELATRLLAWTFAQ